MLTVLQVVRHDESSRELELYIIVARGERSSVFFFAAARLPVGAIVERKKKLTLLVSILRALAL